MLPQLTALVAGVQSIKIRRQLGRLAAFILLKKIAHKFNVFHVKFMSDFGWAGRI